MPIRIYQHKIESQWSREVPEPFRGMLENDVREPVLARLREEYPEDGYDYETGEDRWVDGERGKVYRYAVVPVRRTLLDCGIGDCVSECLIPEFCRRRQQYDMPMLPSVHYRYGGPIETHIRPDVRSFTPHQLAGGGKTLWLWERIR